MRRRSTLARRAASASLALAASLLTGCVSEGELRQAVSDDLRFTGRVMGFALDASVEALETRRGLLLAFQGDERLPVIEQHLGTLGEVEAKLERVREERRRLIEESQALRTRWAPEDEQ